jgi:enoyl-CoA hydratase/carnithine racemase
MIFETLVNTSDGPIATITLNHPNELNTIVPPMPQEFETAVHLAVKDTSIKVIILRGAGRSFCAGYDFGGGFHLWDEHITTNGAWDAGKDFAWATAQAVAPTQKFMSMWRAPKPVIAQVHGWCVGGGSDTALCADLVIASEDARIGTPYSRMWRCYLSGLWLYRLGLTKAKEYALTGKPLSGREAADVGLINRAGTFRRTRGNRPSHGGAARLDPAITIGGNETHRQPGVREHGALQHADSRADPRRIDAQYSGRDRLRSPRGARRGACRDHRARRSFPRLQPGACGRTAQSQSRYYNLACWLLA